MAKLIVSIPGRLDKEIRIHPDRILTIGRDPSNDLPIDNPGVSRFHAKIYKQEWSFYVEDLKSTNGTHLNETQVNWKMALNSHDRITIGKCVLVFHATPADYGDGGGRAADPNATIRIKKS